MGLHAERFLVPNRIIYVKTYTCRHRAWESLSVERDLHRFKLYIGVGENRLGLKMKNFTNPDINIPLRDSNNYDNNKNIIKNEPSR